MAEYPPRNCIVCGIEFIPWRGDMYFCSHVGVESCWAKLRNAERDHEILAIKATVRQRYRCFFCKEVLQTIRPHILAPAALSDDNNEITDEDMVASCLACRKKHYVELATTTTDAQVQE